MQRKVSHSLFYLTRSALPLLSPLLHPLDPHQITLLHYIPYARRKIIKVLPPRCNKSEPLYTRTLWRLVTAPAPWTPDEKWRERRPRFEREASDDDGSASDDARMDLEAATLEEPDELTIWVEKGIIHFDDGDTLTGMALRGRWAQFGSSDLNEAWWSFKAKDCKFTPRGVSHHRSRASQLLASIPATGLLSEKTANWQLF